MSIWKNKHVLIATLTAPVLGLLSYFGISALVGEKPHVAEPGQSYQLVEKPNCRYASGNCGLKNGEFELQFSYEKLEGNRILLKLRSANPLNGVKLALAANEDDATQPEDMGALDNDGLVWALDITNPDPEHQRLYLVAAASESFYYGDVAMKFLLADSP